MLEPKPEKFSRLWNDLSVVKVSYFETHVWSVLAAIYSDISMFILLVMSMYCILSN